MEAGGCVQGAVRVEQPTRRYCSDEGGQLCLDRLGWGCSPPQDKQGGDEEQMQGFGVEFTSE